MAKFLTRAGIVIETNDKDKIECYKAQGLSEYVYDPQPIQDVEIAEEYVVRPAKKKKVTKKGV